ncbi:MAG: hypothetical protein QF733_08385 [Phycisphaerales bacterium]|jgi:hypothetical protein|nr:hypothetical protein [Phycisphaerales bacterium]
MSVTSTRPETLEALISRHGPACRDRAEAGIARVRARWTEEDGDADAFHAFCLKRFVPADALPALLDRLEVAMEQINGHLYEMGRTLRRWSDLRGDRMEEIDDILAMFDPSPDLSDQFYKQKLAFVALLNFDRPDLDDMLRNGGDWDAETWAAVRICRIFGPRIPTEVSELARELGHRADTFVADFHVPVGTLVTPDGSRPFDADRKLLAHWIIREEVRGGYADPNGLERQRAVMWVMRRHIDGTIPASIMAGEDLGDWDPQANTIGGSPATDVFGLDRYDRWLDMFTVAKAYDEHYPDHPTAIARKFDLQREIPEDVVESLLVDLLASPARHKLSTLIEERLQRPLEAHDIYFDQISEQESVAELDAKVRERFGDHRGLQLALPDVLRSLGYPGGAADFLGSRVRVEIARGAGHAMRPLLPEYDAWLRTNSLDLELGWDGFDTAMHELGHNLEQLCSTHFVPRPALRGVPNTACTEAFAFLYQDLAPRVLGINEDAALKEDTTAVETMLAACQIAGPALLEIKVWRWLYANPDADAESLRACVLRIADELWTAHFQEHFGPDPYATLAAYQHMIAYPLYLADYALGHIISHQVRRHVRTRDLAAETHRICSIGRLTPDAWMRQAVGSGIDATMLGRDAEAACARLRESR